MEVPRENAVMVTAPSAIERRVPISDSFRRYSCFSSIWKKVCQKYFVGLKRLEKEKNMIFQYEFFIIP